MKKENIFFTALWIVLAVLVIHLYVRNNKPHEYVPSRLESRYELNILAKKYEIPLSVAQALTTRKWRIKNEKGGTDWKASIEKASVDSGVSEKVIAAFLLDYELLHKNSE